MPALSHSGSDDGSAPSLIGGAFSFFGRQATLFRVYGSRAVNCQLHILCEQSTASATRGGKGRF